MARAKSISAPAKRTLLLLMIGFALFLFLSG
jgi:hypothetical protein